MKRYTIGILFSETLSDIVLIEKKKPDCQKGLLNFPCGNIKEGETPNECISRKFLEECGVDIPDNEWKHIGKIINSDEDIINYYVDVLTAVDKRIYPIVETLTDEDVRWYREIPENRISNIIWLIEFARNTHKQSKNDLLTFGTFEYKYPVTKQENINQMIINRDANFDKTIPYKRRY